MKKPTISPIAPNRAPPAGGTPGSQAPNRNGRRQAGRSPRVRVADGIYRDHHGLAANVQGQGVQREIGFRRNAAQHHPSTARRSSPQPADAPGSRPAQPSPRLPPRRSASIWPRCRPSTTRWRRPVPNRSPTPPRDGPRRARTDWLARPPKPDPVTVYRMRRPFATCLRPAGLTSRTSGICTRHRRHRRAALPRRRSSPTRPTRSPVRVVATRYRRDLPPAGDRCPKRATMGPS